MADLEEAIRLQRRAVELTGEGHPDKPMYLNNLGNSYESRFARLCELEDYDFALSAYQQAAESRVAFPSIALSAARGWSKIAQEQADLASALQGFERALDLLPRVAWTGLGPQSRQDWLLKEQPEKLGCAAAACAIQLGKLEKSIELLDMGKISPSTGRKPFNRLLGRSVFWTQATSLRRPLEEEFRKHQPELARQFDQISKELDAGNFSPLDGQIRLDAQATADQINSDARAAAERRINLADQYDTLLGKIRAIPQFERFLKPQACTSLLRSLRDGVLIIVNVCSFGVGALIIRPNSPIHHLPLPTLSEKLLEERALDFVERKDDYLFKSEVLWDGLVRPILGQLEIDPLHPPAHPSLRIRWYLTGPLTSIPLHALGPPDGQDGADLHRLVISSYIMTMSSFSRNTQHPSGPQHMLSVGVRETPGRPKLNSLDYAEDEVKEVIKTLREKGWPPGRITSFDDTTSALVENILPALKTCSWLHLACHGLPNFDSPLQSAFALYDRDLTMEAIASCHGFRRHAFNIE